MNENETENSSAPEQEPVPVVLKELPPVTFAWAMNAVLKILCALAVYGMVLAAIYVLLYSITHLR